MHDILHDTPIYQLILEEGREKELQEGLRKGLKEGRGKGLKEGLAKAREEECLNLRMIIINIVQARFPGLVETVKIQVAPIEDVAVLRQLVIQLGIAQDHESIQQCFTTDHPTAH